MTVHYQDEMVTLHHGDCLDVLRDIPDCSVDSVVTDPPYGLANTDPRHVADTIVRWVNGERDYLPSGAGFMGKEWDAFVPPPAVWDEAMRVLKPGGHLLCFAGSRTVDLMGLSIRLAGFDIRDGIAWLYGSGFPKSLDVSKAIDRTRDDRPEVLAVTTQIKALRDAAGLTNRQLDDLFEFAGMAGHWTSTKSQPAVPTVEQWSKLREVLSPSVELDAEVWRLNGRKGTPGEAWEQREVVGERVTGIGTGRGAVAYIGDSDNRDITAPATDAARQWAGWGTALKPAHEPIVVARKPLTGTVAANVQQHGTGALNIDASRVATDWATDPTRRGWQGRNLASESTVSFVDQNKETSQPNAAGRWPTNVLLDESQAAALDQQTGVLTSGANPTRRGADGNRATFGEFAGQADANPQRGADSGGASRFFPTFRYEAKAPTSERPTADGVAHPTVKPLDLMRWLVRLVTPPGGVVLEPFAGSGTTAEACVLEHMRCIAIEREATYLPLIVQRLSKPMSIGFNFDEGGAA